MNLNERLLVQMVVAMYRGGRRKAKTGCAYRFMTAVQAVAFGNLFGNSFGNEWNYEHRKV